MLGKVASHRPCIDVIAAARREADRDVDGLSFVEIFRSRRRIGDDETRRNQRQQKSRASFKHQYSPVEWNSTELHSSRQVTAPPGSEQVGAMAQHRRQVNQLRWRYSRSSRNGLAS